MPNRPPDFLWRAFLPRAEAILRQLADAKQEIEEMSGTERGKLVIGSIPTVARYFLPTCLASFNRTFLQIRVTVVEEFTTDLLDRLEGGVIDLALLALPVAGSNFLCQEVLRERLYVVVPRDHRLAKQTSIHLKHVENDPFLLLKEGHYFRDNTLSACGRARLDPNVVFESGQFTTILAMVRRHRCFGSAAYGSRAAPGMPFIPLADEGAFRRVGIVQLKQHFRSRAHQAFLSTSNKPPPRSIPTKTS